MVIHQGMWGRSVRFDINAVYKKMIIFNWYYTSRSYIHCCCQVTLLCQSPQRHGRDWSRHRSCACCHCRRGQRHLQNSAASTSVTADADRSTRTKPLRHRFLPAPILFGSVLKFSIHQSRLVNGCRLRRWWQVQRRWLERTLTNHSIRPRIQCRYHILNSQSTAENAGLQNYPSDIYAVHLLLLLTHRLKETISLLNPLNRSLHNRTSTDQ